MYTFKFGTYRPIKSFDLRPSKALASLSIIDIVKNVKPNGYQSKNKNNQKPGDFGNFVRFNRIH